MGIVYSNVTIVNYGLCRKIAFAPVARMSDEFPRGVIKLSVSPVTAVQLFNVMFFYVHPVYLPVGQRRRKDTGTTIMSLSHVHVFTVVRRRDAGSELPKFDSH